MHRFLLLLLKILLIGGGWLLRGAWDHFLLLIHCGCRDRRLGHYCLRRWLFCVELWLFWNGVFCDFGGRFLGFLLFDEPLLHRLQDHLIML